MAPLIVTVRREGTPANRRVRIELDSDMSDFDTKKAIREKLGIPSVPVRRRLPIISHTIRAKETRVLLNPESLSLLDSLCAGLPLTYIGSLVALPAVQKIFAWTL